MLKDYHSSPEKSSKNYQSAKYDFHVMLHSSSGSQGGHLITKLDQSLSPGAVVISHSVAKRPYGTGNVQRIGKYYHARFYDAAGNRHSESTKTDDKNKALRYLQRRLGQIAAGQNPQLPKHVGKLADLYFAHLAVEAGSVPAGLPAPITAWRKDRKHKELSLQKARWDNHLADHFAGARAVRLEMLDEYVTVRRNEHAQDATITRELALLRRVLNYNRVPNVPKFPRLAESAPRSGFVEDEQFEKIYQAIKDAGLRAMVTAIYRYGFRKSELQNLLAQQLEGRALRLLPGTTKNSRPRKVILDSRTWADVEPLLNGKVPDDYVFTWSSGNKRGHQIRDFRHAWQRACESAGVPGLTPYDLRRSAIRNMVRRGIPERVARMISGHLTGEVFARYDIIGDKDLEQAAEKIGA